MRRLGISVTVGLGRLGPAMACLATLIAISTSGSSALLIAQDAPPGYATPQARAAYLGLPVPAPYADVEHERCAADVDGGFPVTCFRQLDQVESYITGTRDAALNLAHQVNLAGFGGTSASVTGSPAVGRTCAAFGCSGASTTWYSTTSANCTHTYPNNDYYRNAVATYYYALNLSTGVANLNCNRMILYRDATQGGAGALDCGSTTSACGSGAISYQSISWHNG